MRKGEYEKAELLAQALVGESEDIFFIKSYLAFLKKEDLSPFENYKKHFPGSPFVMYFEAYLALLDGREEEALWHYTRLVDLKEGWLARELIEKAKQKNLLKLAQTQDISYFVPLPESSSFFSLIWQKIRKRRTHTFILVFVLIVTLAFSYLFFRDYIRKKNDPIVWENLDLDEAAHILPQGQGEGRHYYANRQDLKQDFLLARQYLQQGKTNRARYYLQRILHSNADFRSRQKAKIFLNLIPEPEFENFSDNIAAKDLLAESFFYLNCYLLWEGLMHTWKKETGGFRGSLVVHENNDDYFVEIFWPQNPESSDSSLSFPKSLPAKALVFGQFKGLLGKQRLIYLEAREVRF